MNILEDSNRKNEIVKLMTDVEYYPVPYKKEEVSVEKYTKLPLAKISAMGAAFEPLTTAFQNIFVNNAASSGASGLYKVTVPVGKNLVKFADGSGFTGAIARGNNQVGGGMAILNPINSGNPLVCNPATLFMAAALMSIDKKLDNNQEIQKDIFEFLIQKEKSKLRGNLNFLTDVMNNYKYNWTNEKYKTNNHIKALDIKQDSEQSILLYREQINKIIKKSSFLHSDKDVDEKMKKIQSEFEEYQLALYLYSLSAFIEVMLLENFKSEYLDGITKKIDDYVFQYRELYNECIKQIEGYSKSSVQSNLLGGLKNISKAAGNVIAKIPVVSKSQIDETLINTSGKLEKVNEIKTTQTLNQLLNSKNSAVYTFIENINTINRLYNKPMELLFDEENIYINLPENIISA